MILQWFGSEHQNGDSIISVFWRLWAANCQNILQFSRQTLKAAVKEIWKTKMSFKFLREDDATQKRAMNLKKSWKKMVSTLALTFWNVKTLEISLKGKIYVKLLVKNSCDFTQKMFSKIFCRNSFHTFDIWIDEISGIQIQWLFGVLIVELVLT